MSNLKQLQEKRAEVFSKMEEMSGKLGPDGKFDSDGEARYAALESDFDDLTAKIKVEERREARAREMAQQQFMSSRSTETEEVDAEKAYRDAFMAYTIGGTAALTIAQREALKRGEVRGTSTQVSTTNNLGGYLVPKGFEAEIEKQLKMYAMFPDFVSVLTTDTGNTIEMPTVDDTSTIAAMNTQANAVGVQDVTFGQLMFGAYTYATLIRAREELLQDSALNLELLFAELAGERIGRAMSSSCTTGTGSSQPQGIVVGSSLGVTAGSATVITRDNLVDLVHSVDAAYRRSPGTAFMFSDTTAAAIRKLAIGANDARGLWEPSLQVGQPDRLLGYNVVINNDMANIGASAKAILFGDMRKYRLRRVRSFVVKRLDERFAESLEVGFLTAARWDGKVVNPSAIKHLVMGA